MNRPTCSWVLRSCLLLAFAVVASILPLQAQVDTGSITGTVTDASGAVLGGARVTLTNEGTGATLTVNTNSDGTYTFSPVRIGSYKIEASAQGFKTVSQPKVVVNVAANVLVNLKLTPGSVSETVEVSASAPVLQTQDASVGQVVDQRAVNDLPLNGRNFTFLAQLAAGVNSPQADTRGNAATGAFAANGFRPAQNNYMLDGIDNNSDTVDFLNGTNFVVLPPVDAVQEFNVQTTNFSAEYGRSGAAVLNATIKSGTNEFHGDVWEFLRNDKFDAADYFERTGKSELRQNDYGFTLGGPIIKKKVFIFGDYNGFRRRQGVPHNGAVPTDAQRQGLEALGTGATTLNLQDLITLQNGTQTDDLGRTWPLGTVFDPATTHLTASGWVREPFGTTCVNAPAGTYDLSTCPDLNIIPAGRIDSNAAALMLLYPAPNGSSLLSNYNVSPKLSENRNSFDTRLDLNLSEKDSLFYRFSYVDDPQYIPSIFTGVADGGAFFEGNQTALAQQSALVWNHVFSPTLVNNARAGLNYLHTTRVGPEANKMGIPEQYGIQGVPQVKLNGGLPAFGFNGLSTLGSNAFLPSDEVSSTIQFSDDLTKIYGKHTFKGGFELQHVKYSTLQPPWSHAEEDFDNGYADIVGSNSGHTGIAQILLTPMQNSMGTGANFADYVGGPGHILLSNLFQSDNGKNYWGAYFQDDWKVSQKLTLNLGLRWDFFGLTYDHHGGQANFVPFGPPTGSPMYILPVSAAANNVSPSFTALTQKDGINVVVTNKYGKGLGNSQYTNFAPRFGFAYQVTPKLVARGGFGVFYNGFENRGYYPNLGENYPFQFQFGFGGQGASVNNAQHIFFTGCTTPGPGGSVNGNATLETGFACTPLDPALVNASGLAFRGIQFNYVTPRSLGANLSLQYQVTSSMSFQAAYVYTAGRHLEVFPNDNTVTQLLPAVDNTGAGLNQDNYKQFLDFGYGMPYAQTDGSSYYHSLQTKLEKRFTHGLDFLLTYTYSKVRSDAVDLLNGFGQGYRAANIPGFGIQHDYGLANYDIRNVVHLSGEYELPFGRGKPFMGNASAVTNQVVGGWKFGWAGTFQGGQPFLIGCNKGTATGVGCNAWVIPGQNPKVSRHLAADGNVVMYTASAFAQACQLQATSALPTPPGAPPMAPLPDSPTGCVPLTGLAALGGNQPSQVEGPGLYRADLTVFKNFPITERVRLEFRTDFFNITNTPSFNAPGFGGNGVVSVSGSTDFVHPATFGEVASTRLKPYDPRQIQFALKLYF